MALVKILNSDQLKKIASKGQDTDVAQFFYDEDKRVQLVMKRPPEVMDVPQRKQKGSIRLNKHKTVPLNPDKKHLLRSQKKWIEPIKQFIITG